jgi:hypothetical protein
MHLRVTDEIEEIGLDYDQFDDETVGEWGLYDTQEGHARRASNAGSIIHGVPAANSASGTQTPTDVEQVKEQNDAKRD